MKFTHAFTTFSVLAGAAYSIPTVPATCAASSDLSLIDPPPGISQELLFEAASPVGMIIAGLGLSKVAPGLVAQIDNTENITVPVAGPLSELLEITTVPAEQVTQLVQGLIQLNVTLGNADEAAEEAVAAVVTAVGNLLTLPFTVYSNFLGFIAELLGGEIANAPPAGFGQAAPILITIISGLRLDEVAPGLIPLLSLLSVAA